jgi:hypothetical protein
MSLKADETFGIEPVTMGATTKDIDVGELADALSDALDAAAKADGPPPGGPAAVDGAGGPPGESVSGHLARDGKVVNGVLERFGFPPIARPLAAVNFARAVVARFVEQKKTAYGVGGSDDGPGSPDSYQDFDSAP